LPFFPNSELGKISLSLTLGGFMLNQFSCQEIVNHLMERPDFFGIVVHSQKEVEKVEPHHEFTLTYNQCINKLDVAKLLYNSAIELENA
jgi:hypothetical protein